MPTLYKGFFIKSYVITLFTLFSQKIRRQTINDSKGCLATSCFFPFHGTVKGSIRSFSGFSQPKISWSTGEDGSASAQRSIPSASDLIKVFRNNYLVSQDYNNWFSQDLGFGLFRRHSRLSRPLQSEPCSQFPHNSIKIGFTFVLGTVDIIMLQKFDSAERKKFKP